MGGEKFFLRTFYFSLKYDTYIYVSNIYKKEDAMPFEKNINMLTRMRDARLKKLADSKPLIAGTVVTYRRVCGNPRCKCARGEKHTSHHLTYKDRNRKTVSVYIPVDKIEEVKAWVKEYRRTKELLRQISDLQRNILKRHVTEKRRRKGRP